MGRKATNTTSSVKSPSAEKEVEHLLEQYQQIKDRPAFSIESQAHAEKKAKAIKHALEKEGYTVIDSTTGNAKLKSIVGAAALPCPMEDES